MRDKWVIAWQWRIYRLTHKMLVLLWYIRQAYICQWPSKVEAITACSLLQTRSWDCWASSLWICWCALKYRFFLSDLKYVQIFMRFWKLFRTPKIENTREMRRKFKNREETKASLLDLDLALTKTQMSVSWEFLSDTLKDAKQKTKQS